MIFMNSSFPARQLAGTHLQWTAHVQGYHPALSQSVRKVFDQGAFGRNGNNSTAGRMWISVETKSAPPAARNLFDGRARTGS
jgi:hypothetical protein